MTSTIAGIVTSQRYSRLIALSAFVLMIIIQLILAIRYAGTQQLSDYQTYMALARDCHDNGAWYPMAQNLYDPYIFAPGLVNYLILQLNIFGSFQVNPFINILLNIIVIRLVFSFARRFFSAHAAWWSVTLYCLMYSTWWSIVPAGTELPFLTLSLCGLWLVLRHNPWMALAAGICFALANWIRPLVMIYIFVGIVLVCITYRKSLRHIVVSIAGIVVGFIITVFAIGTFSRQACGEFITKSSTGGINLIYTANDKAYGGVASSLLNDSTNTCFIDKAETLTYAQKDSIWKSRAIEWISDHPLQYAKLYVMKWPGIFVEDAWPDRAVLTGAGMVDAYVHGHISFARFLPHAIGLVAKSLVYYIVLFLFIASVIKYRRDILTPKGLWLLLWFGGVAGTCLLAVTPRYHYPFLFVMVMWSAYGLTRYCSNSVKKHRLSQE